MDHLSPYLESSGVTFRHGANFAVAGATAAAQSKSFSLPTQVRQFRHFKARTAELLPLGQCMHACVHIYICFHTERSRATMKRDTALIYAAM